MIGRTSLVRKMSKAIRTAVEQLESRQLFAVNVTNPLSDITTAVGSANQTISLANTMATTLPVTASGTVVRFVMQAGTNGASQNVDIVLYDVATDGHSAAPISVANFLNYVNGGSYTNSFIHRAMNFSNGGSDARTSPAWFLQGGGFNVTTNGSSPSVGTITTGGPINLEWAADRPNVAGTISYARTSDPNSATSGFFLNTADNSSIFDQAGNQYAVFGKLTDSSLAVVQQYAAFTRVDADGDGNSNSGTYNNLPVSDSSASDLFSVLVYVRSASVVSVSSSNITYTVTSSNTDVVSPSIDGSGNLILDYGTTTGSATITVTGKDASGQTTQDQFTVNALIPGGPSVSIKNGNATITDDQSAPVSLGSVTIGSTPSSTTLTITNNGDQTLNLSGVTADTGFIVQSFTNTAIEPGSSGTIVLTYDGSTIASYSGKLTVTSNATDGTFLIPLTAAVVADQKTVTLSTSLTSLTFTDADGTVVKFTHSGPGTTVLTFTGATDPTTKGKAATITAAEGKTLVLSGVSLSDTSSRTSVSTTVKGGNGSVSIPSLTSTAAVGTLKLTGGAVSTTLNLASSVTTLLLASVGGNATIGGAVKSATVGNVANATIVLNGIVTTLTAETVGASTVTAQGVSTLNVKGDVNNSTLTLNGTAKTLSLGSATSSTITAGAVSTVTLKGAVTNTRFNISGPVSSFKAASLSGSTVAVGLNSNVTTPAAASDFAASSSLKSLTLTSKAAGAFANSQIFASVLGKASIGLFSADTTNTTSIFVTSATQISGKGSNNKAFSIKKFNSASASLEPTLTAAGLTNTQLNVRALT